MAKRKTKVVYRYRKKKRSKKQDTGLFNLGGIMKPLSATAYGFFRDKVSDAIQNSRIGQQLPATNFTDEGAMLGVMYVARKLGLSRNKLAGAVIRNGETVEWARIGETLSDMQQNKMGTVASTGTLF